MDFHPGFVDEFSFDTISQVSFRAKGIEFRFEIHENRNKRFNVLNLKKNVRDSMKIILRETMKPNLRKRVNVVVYNIPKRKVIPEGVGQYCDAKHFNSGYCFLRSAETDTNIVIYRSEEFYKVLIHELLHLFDTFPFSVELQEFYQNKFTCVYRINVNESIVEMNALRINSEIMANRLSRHPNDLLKDEYRFSATQVKKLIFQQNTTFERVMRNDFVWRETTNAFSYFVLKHIMLHDLLYSSSPKLVSEPFRFSTKPPRNLFIKMSKYCMVS